MSGSERSGTMPEGWYDDPEGVHGLRWWDGRSWTEHVQHAPTQAADKWLTSGSGEQPAGSAGTSTGTVLVAAALVTLASIAGLAVLTAVGVLLLGRTAGHVSKSTPQALPTGLSVLANPDGSNDYALRAVTCTVSASSAMVIATGTFAGANGAPLPALPADVTYNVNVGVFDAHTNVIGISASNESTEYMDSGGRWSVDVKLFRRTPPASCMVSIGTYGTAPATPSVTP